MSLEKIIQILKSGTIYTDGTWVLVMGGQGAELNTLSTGLAQISIRVENATTLDQAVALIGANELPPILAYFFADGLGGLDNALRLHASLQKITHIGKSLIVSSEQNPDFDFSSMTENAPLILSAPKKTRLN
ncbi:hypothetical protein N9A67_02760 [Rhodobacteraceae bacterium]|nr:hypothetical protein [Paracoccaceae bacterium]